LQPPSIGVDFPSLACCRHDQIRDLNIRSKAFAAIIRQRFVSKGPKELAKRPRHGGFSNKTDAFEKGW
jgi:hypothetical protein